MKQRLSAESFCDSKTAKHFLEPSVKFAIVEQWKYLLIASCCASFTSANRQ